MSLAVDVKVSRATRCTWTNTATRRLTTLCWLCLLITASTQLTSNDIELCALSVTFKPANLHHRSVRVLLDTKQYKIYKFCIYIYKTVNLYTHTVETVSYMQEVAHRRQQHCNISHSGSSAQLVSAFSLLTSRNSCFTCAISACRC